MKKLLIFCLCIPAAYMIAMDNESQQDDGLNEIMKQFTSLVTLVQKESTNAKQKMIESCTQENARAVLNKTKRTACDLLRKYETWILSSSSAEPMEKTAVKPEELQTASEDGMSVYYPIDFSKLDEQQQQTILSLVGSQKISVDIASLNEGSADTFWDIIDRTQNDQ